MILDGLTKAVLAADTAKPCRKCGGQLPEPVIHMVGAHVGFAGWVCSCGTVYQRAVNILEALE